MLEIQSKSLQWEISLHWFQIQAVYCCHQSSMSPAFFVIKLLAKYFVCLLSLGAWKFTFTHPEYFLISFKLITPIAFYNLPFTRLYFASSSPNVVIDIFPCYFLLSLKKACLQDQILLGIFCIFLTCLDFVVLYFNPNWINLIFFQRCLVLAR